MAEAHHHPSDLDPDVLSGIDIPTGIAGNARLNVREPLLQQGDPGPELSDFLLGLGLRTRRWRGEQAANKQDRRDISH